MSKSKIIIILLFILFIALFFLPSFKKDGFNITGNENEIKAENKISQFPDFYRGVYLNNETAGKFDLLKAIVEESKKSYINTVVMDIQSAKGGANIIQKENIKYCMDNGMHTIARIVVFPGGLNHYPPSEKHLSDIINIAEESCKNGFREIQFDYIRFSDENRHVKNLKHVSLRERYLFVEEFLTRARNVIKKYNARIAIDIFGRVPHNNADRIGQNMEYLDNVVDVICPMAYPSHYWTKKLKSEPYETVKWTSSEANKRTRSTDIVTYIQAFQMSMPKTMDFSTYIQEEIRAVHDAGVKGFILWNAKQDYKVPLQAVIAYYNAEKIKGIKKE